MKIIQPNTISVNLKFLLSYNLIKNIEFMNKLMKDIIIKKNTEKYENEFNEKTKEVEEVINILLNLF